MNKLTRVLSNGMKGKDVEGCRRACARLLGGVYWTTFVKQSTTSRRNYGIGMVNLVKKAQAHMVHTIPDGKIGPKTESDLRKWDAFDAKADLLLDQYAESLKPHIVEPLQGFDSLKHSLLEVYSIGRNMGLSDQGTYNRSSRLPSGKPSDHAKYPAKAFDLGFSPATGEHHPVAKKFFDLAIVRPEVKYVILGRLIWSEDRGLHAYTYGGHESHVHTSGN